jgi:hypothetical protein
MKKILIAILQEIAQASKNMEPCAYEPDDTIAVNTKTIEDKVTEALNLLEE